MSDSQLFGEPSVADLTSRVSRLETEMAANTRLTEEIHGKTAEMYELFDTARNGFRMIAKVGNGAARVGRGAASTIDAVGKVAKPLFWIAALGAASWAWWKTGTFSIPDWSILK